jgi:hypothetical protein
MKERTMKSNEKQRIILALLAYGLTILPPPNFSHPRDCVVTPAGGHERGSISGRGRHPTLFRGFSQRDGGFEGQQKYLVFSLPRSMEEPLLYDSERMSFRLGLAIP